MNNSTVVFLINDDVRAIKAIYEPTGAAMTFKTMNQSIRVDDYVVVQTNTRHEMTIVKVTEVDVDVDLESSTKMDWVVDTVDLRNFNVVLEQERTAIAAVQSAQKRKKREELRAALFRDNDENIKALALSSDEDHVTE